jgi:hypothetical protein
VARTIRSTTDFQFDACVLSSVEPGSFFAAGSPPRRPPEGPFVPSWDPQHLGQPHWQPISRTPAADTAEGL